MRQQGGQYEEEASSGLGPSGVFAGVGATVAGKLAINSQIVDEPRSKMDRPSSDPTSPYPLPQHLPGTTSVFKSSWTSLWSINPR
jgi:hypothetical protein